MTALALCESVTLACTAGSSLRQVVPLRLSKVSQPTAVSQRSSDSAGTPCFLKSWNSACKPWSFSQVRAFFDGVAVGNAVNDGVHGVLSKLVEVSLGDNRGL